MGATPEQLKADIDRTRAELAADVDTLTERVSPRSITRRRTQAMKSRAQRLKERVMGPARDMQSSAAETASSIGEGVQQAPAMVRSRTEGNPLAAGIIAFGGGLLAATAFPSTRKESEVVDRMMDQARDLAEPLQGTAKGAAQEMVEQMKPAAREAVESVKETATEAASRTTEQARSAASEARSSTPGEPR